MSVQRVVPGLGWASLIVLILLLVWLAGPFRAVAQAPDDIGRYQISSWASYAGERVHHSGYYIIDTTTGKVVDRGHEIHGIDDAGRR